MKKKRDINELRQTKDAVYTNPGVQKPSQSFIEDQEAAKQMAEIDKQEKMNPSKYTKNDLEQAKCSIAEKIIKHFDDTLFEMVCEEMSNNYLFQSDNYLTEAGYDIWEDEWFEFYHEHHGDILHQVRQSLTN
jgi:hypothetical protein